MAEWTLMRVGTQSYIYDINLKTQMIRYLVGDIDEIPGINFGRSNGGFMTRAQWEFFRDGVTMDGPSLTEEEKSWINQRYPDLLDKAQALYEAICQTPSKHDLPVMHAIRMLVRFYIKNNEGALQETWKELLKYLITKQNNVDNVAYLKRVWSFTTNQDLLDTLLWKWSSYFCEFIESKELQKFRSQQVAYSVDELANIIFNETRSVIPCSPGGTKKQLAEDRVEIGKIILLYPTKLHATHVLKNMREEEKPILRDCKKAAIQARNEYIFGKFTQYGHFIVHNEKYKGILNSAKQEWYAKEKFGHIHIVEGEVKYWNSAPAGRKTIYSDDRIMKDKDILFKDKWNYPTIIMFFYDASKENPNIRRKK